MNEHAIEFSLITTNRVVCGQNHQITNAENTMDRTFKKWKRIQKTAETFRTHNEKRNLTGNIEDKRERGN